MFLFLLGALAVTQTVLGFSSETTNPDLSNDKTLAITTPAADEVKATTSKLIEPDIPTQICNTDAPFLMICKCEGQNFTHDNVVNTIPNKIEKDVFEDKLHKTDRLELENCNLVENSTLLTNSMYYLTEISLKDCSNVSQNIFNMMARKFLREPIGELNKDEQSTASIQIIYTKETKDVWPSNFTILPTCSGSFSVKKDYALHKLQLTNIPNMQNIDSCMIEQFPYMQWLDISNNNMQVFPNISGWEQLRVLKCRSCKLKDIPFSNLLPTSLEHIDLSRNEIVHAQQLCYEDKCYMRQDGGLYYINLAYNKIRYFPDFTFKYVKFRGEASDNIFDGEIRIDLSNNELVTFSHRVINDINKNRTDSRYPVVIHAEDNPFYCGCNMFDVKDAVARSENFRFYGMCETPPQLEGLSVNKLSRSLDTLKVCSPSIVPSDKEPVSHSWRLFGEVVLGLAIVAMVVVLTLIVHKYVKSWRHTSSGSRRSNRGPTSIVTNYRHMRMNNENEDEYMTDVTIGGVGDGSASNDVMNRQYNPDEDVFTIEERSSSSTAAAAAAAAMRSMNN